MNSAAHAFLYLLIRMLLLLLFALKVDDDAYVMVDNLRSFLADYDPDKPHYFGERSKQSVAFILAPNKELSST